MRFLPYEHFVIHSPLAVAAARKLLDEVVGEPRLRWGAKPLLPYVGTLTDTTFDVRRVIDYRNSFLPEIHGAIHSMPVGCAIEITMRPHWLVLGFMVFWLGGVACANVVFLLGLLAGTVENHTNSPVAFLILPAMLGFGLLLFGGGFKFESIKSRAFFVELFQATQVAELGFGKFEAGEGGGLS